MSCGAFLKNYNIKRNTSKFFPDYKFGAPQGSEFFDSKRYNVVGVITIRTLFGQLLLCS